MTRLEEIIRQYVQLPPTPSGRGFYPVVCKVCNDHGRKGPRAGFKFDQDAVGYNCFNCRHTAKFDPSDPKTLSKNHQNRMLEVLRAFGIPEEEWNRVLFDVLKQRNEIGEKSSSSTKKSLNLIPKTLQLPTFFYPLSESKDDKWAIIAREYLLQRGVDPSSYPFYLSRLEKRHEQWYGRVIIPIYREGNLIFYIGRDLTGKRLRKYYSPSTNKDNVLFGFDKLFIDRTKPLIVVEGWFDAYSVDGVAIFGNHITKEQAEWLNRSPRPKIYVPDKFGDGQRAAMQAIELGWSISTPEIGSCKDLNEAVVKYGKLYVIKTIMDNIATSEFQARTNLNVFCSHDSTTGSKIR